MEELALELTPWIILAVVGLLVLWRSWIPSVDTQDSVSLEHENVLASAQLVQGEPDFGPPPPSATLEQHTNRIHIDDP